VTIITEDKGDYKQGDIVLDVPEAVESKVLDFLGMMGLENARETCKKAIENTKRGASRRAPGDDDPPIQELDDACGQIFLGLSGAALEAQNDILALLRPVDLNNALAIAAPNIHVGDMAAIVEVVRRGFTNGGMPETVLLQERIVRATIALNIVYALIFLSMKGIRSIHLPGSHLIGHKTEEFACPKEELICLDDTCGGEVLDFDPAGGMRVVQTGFCRDVRSLSISHFLDLPKQPRAK
jgi:hypothetical protein